jgi:hypothetical protein
VRIDDHVNSSHHKKPEYGKKTEHVRTRPYFEIPNHQSNQHASVEDVVQLTLSHDGIWEVKSLSPVPSTFPVVSFFVACLLI